MLKGVASGLDCACEWADNNQGDVQSTHLRLKAQRLVSAGIGERAVPERLQRTLVRQRCVGGALAMTDEENRLDLIIRFIIGVVAGSSLARVQLVRKEKNWFVG